MAEGEERGERRDWGKGGIKVRDGWVGGCKDGEKQRETEVNSCFNNLTDWLV